MGGQLKRIGLLVPASDGVSEPDFQLFLPKGVVFHTARLHQHKSLKRGFDNLQRMYNDGPSAAESVALASPDVIVYSCTSASFFKGYGSDRVLAQAIQKTTGIPTIVTSTAAVEALKAIGAKKLFMVMPYPPATLETGLQFFRDAGFEIGGHTRFDCPTSADLVHVGPEMVVKRVLTHRAEIKDCDTVFISGTGFRGMEAVEPLEKALGCPVVTANSATVWAVLRHLKVDGSRVPAGRLFRLPANGRAKRKRAA